MTSGHAAAPSEPPLGAQRPPARLRSRLLRRRGLAIAYATATLGVTFATATGAHAQTQAQSGQPLQTDVTTAIAWGSGDGCRQNMQPQDFGLLTSAPGSDERSAFGALPQSDASTDANGASVWVGCVTANTPVASITAQGTANMADAAGDVLALSHVAIGTTNSVDGSACAITAGQQGAGGCQLTVDGQTQASLAEDLPAGTDEVDWQYQLDLPAGQQAGDYKGGQVTFTATAGAAAAPSNTQPPQISGVAQVGEPLTASTGSWQGSPANFSYAYQWLDCSNGGCAPIADATSAGYTPVPGDAGDTLEVAVTATNSAGSTSATAGPTAPVMQTPGNVTAPALSTDTPLVGSPVSVSDGAWVGAPTPTFSYQWSRCRAGNCTPIAGAAGSSYTPTSDDVGDALQATVTAANPAGQAAATTAQSAAVISGPPAELTAPAFAPANPQQGTPEQASVGTWTNTPSSYTYQWETCSAGICGPIAGATAATYTPAPGDIGSTVEVQVTASNAAGSATATSGASASVLPPAGSATDIPGGLAGGVGCIQQFVTGADGDLYLGNNNTRQIDRITPTGTITAYSIPSGANPCSLTLGPDGNVWFAAISPPTIGKITPAGAITDVYSTGSGASPQGITTGPDGDLYFTLAGSNQIGQLTTAGAVRLFTTPIAGSQPNAIVKGPDGALWFTESQAADIGRMTTSGSFTEFPVDSDLNNGIVAGPDGALWFTDRPNNEIDRLTTSGALSSYPLPIPSAQPDGITVGADGAIWFGQNAAPYVGRIDTAGDITEWAIPSGGNAPSVTAGPDRFVWYDSTVSLGELAPEFTGSAPADTVRPTLSSTTPSTAKTDSVANTGTWTNGPTSFLYQWLDCTASDTCTPISGATDSSYRPTNADVGDLLQVIVTAVNAAGAADSTTLQTSAVAASAHPG